MELVNFIKKEYPAKITEMNPDYSISEINNSYENEMILRSEIMRIAAQWLSLNIKSKSINTDDGLMLVVDYILEECKNLELQEINFIFRNGILGKFGIIYNDISIDTICGKDGWIETYYKDFRRLKIEHVQKDSSVKLTGKEMTLEQFHALNPEFKDKYDLHAIYERAKQSKITIEDAKQFYKIKGLTWDDFKDDFEIFSIQYQKQDLIKGEMIFITEMFRRFIIENIFKNKS